MRCRVKLRRLTDEFIASQTCRPVTQPSSPTDSQVSFDLNSSLTPKVVNTKRESKARPLSKIKSAKSSNLSSLAKMKSFKSHDLGALDTLEKLTKCQGCRVLLFDCLRGAALPQYARHILEQFNSGLDKDFMVDEKSEMKVKKKKKKEKGKEKLNIKVSC